MFIHMGERLHDDGSQASKKSKRKTLTSLHHNMYKDHIEGKMPPGPINVTLAQEGG
jgi:hypothetical protein